MLQFLYAHHGQWAWEYARRLARAVADAYVAEGLPDPRGEDTRRYLLILRKEMGIRRGRPTDAFTLEEVRQFALERAGWPEPTTDTQRFRVTRDVTYLLVGISGAHRHTELQRLRMQDVTQTLRGVSYSVEDHKAALLAKSKASAMPWHVSMDHLGDKGKCPTYCPACALVGLMQVRLEQGALPGDLVFTRPGGGPFGLAGGQAAVRRAWAAVSTVEGVARLPSAKIGVRTLRVTGATLAVEAGMGLLEVRDVLHHQSVDTTLLYLRRLDLAAAEEFSLPV